MTTIDDVLSGRAKWCVVTGDCLDVLRTIPAGSVDAVVTDPPYGIGAGRMSFGAWRTSRMDRGCWDDAPADLSGVIDLGVPTVVWGGNYFPLPPRRGFLLWDKGAGFAGRDFAECEMAWCSTDGNARIYRRDPLANRDYADKVHPTQKPVPLMAWCLEHLSVSTDALILDPFCGSGTTGVACMQTGRRFIGIEIDEGYAAIARRRIAEAANHLFQETAQ